MVYIKNESLDPYYNLAFEEYVLTALRDDDYVLLWQNGRSVIIGRYQNAYDEINEDAAAAFGVKLVRRNSGGGAVFHDTGNLNFSYITDFRDKTEQERIILPVIEAVSKLGVKAEYRGRNDIVGADGRKISGVAMCVTDGRILVHGTLLLDSDLDALGKVLNAGGGKIESKGIKSVRQRVANINEYTNSPVSIAELKSAVLDSIFKGSVRERVLTQNELGDIEKLAASKYASWDWNYGHSPAFNYKNAVRFPAGGIIVNLELEDGRIKQCVIRGDFFSMSDIAPIEKALAGVKFAKSEIRSVLDGFDIPLHFGVTPDELLECFN